MTQGDQGFDPKDLFNERERLSEFPYFDRDGARWEHGVLRSDRIDHYSKKFKLISPFEQKCLRPAGYNLRVGDRYAIGGERKLLKPGATLTIKPYQVAIIQTLETLSIPEFLIGRWNIRVGFAYKGLLWVGGAQVDPGFRGRLCCPIYNLSTTPVKLTHGDQLAMIDFVTTTPFGSGARGVTKPFQWWTDDKKLLFEQYDTGLSSGVESELNRISVESQSSSSAVKDVERRIDTFVTLTFTVVAVLFAGLGIIATRAPDQPAFLNSPVWVAAVALYFALRAAFQPRKSPGRWPPALLALLITGVLVAASLFFEAHHSQATTGDLQRLREEISQTREDLDHERLDRQQTDARNESLRQQIDLLVQNRGKR